MMKDRVDWKRAVELRNLPRSAKLSVLYTDIINTHVNGTKVILQVHTDFLPRGFGAATWLENARIMLINWEDDHPEYEALIGGGAATQADAKAVVMQSMPVYIGVSLVVIMSVVFCMYGSVVLPLRLGFALLFTLAATYGVVVLIYQTPLLHGIFPWLAKYDGICFQVVPIATCVAVALGLDYDIFLISRILEYRLQGLSHTHAVVKGVARTGGIISGAGVIMALSFSGLFFSAKLMHHQFACLLVVSVLLDTFVVRTVLVPALMLSAGDWSWWPRRMPQESGWRSASDSSLDDESLE